MMTCKGWALIFVSMTCHPQGAPPDTFCQIAKPIQWHSSDTRLTKEQADAHNRKWKRLCSVRQ